MDMGVTEQSDELRFVVDARRPTRPLEPSEFLQPVTEIDDSENETQTTCGHIYTSPGASAGRRTSATASSVIAPLATTIERTSISPTPRPRCPNKGPSLVAVEVSLLTQRYTCLSSANPGVHVEWNHGESAELTLPKIAVST